MRVIITGGAGFIGSALCRYAVLEKGWSVLNIDKLTYAGNLQSLKSIENQQNYQFLQADICDAEKIARAFADFAPDAVMHLAAESHVDRSITGSAAFIQTNLVGTYTMLEAARSYWQTLPKDQQAAFRFQHISTDEVYGSLGDSGTFTEQTPYDPRSPYSATKAGSDHLVRAWHETYGLPTLITNCSNNYGPFHFPEKLIPLIILNALEGKPLPVYGRGENIRDWLYVDDHARALALVVEKGRAGETYNIGGNAERANLDVVEAICDALDKRLPMHIPRRSLIKFVTDRPGHDFRYAIDASKIRHELGWQPLESFETGLNKTIDWFLQNEGWWRPIRDQRYSGERLGL